MGTIAEELPTKSPEQVIEQVRLKLSEAPTQKGAAYTLIVGAGFSHGVVPVTKELLHERIGDYYFDNPDSLQRSSRQKEKLSALFWREFNAAGSPDGEDLVKLNEQNLPVDPTAAYQLLFTYRVANLMWSNGADARPRSRVIGGESFVKDFLRHVLDPGGYDARYERHGPTGDYVTIGRNNINAAHFFLASLLELQQAGELWKLRPFCRTIFTTNFDTLLQNALQLANVLYSLTDRPERGFAASDFPEDDRIIHLVYTHGSILRHNPASTTDELAGLSRTNEALLKSYLQTRDVIVLGYGGWNDSLMSALAGRDGTRHMTYWCNVHPADAPAEKLPSPVRHLLGTGRAAYVPLGPEGADGFMARLFQAVASESGLPALLRDPMREFRNRIGLVTLHGLVLTCRENSGAVAYGGLPTPRLEADASLIHGMACRVLDRAHDLVLADKTAPVTAEREGAATAPEPRPEQAEAKACALIVEGFALAQAGNLNAAGQTWCRVLSLVDAPPFERALAANYAGTAHAQLDRHDLAIQAYGKAIDVNHGSPELLAEALVNRGVAYHRSRNLDSALEDFSRAITISHNHRPASAMGARALVYRGLTYQAKGNADMAKRDLNCARTRRDLPPDCAELLSLTRKQTDGGQTAPA